MLDIVQDILASIDGEEINSITDTVESEQVARIVRQTYYDISPSINDKVQHKLFHLEASGDNTKPVLMTIPSNVVDVDWIKYDNKLTGGANSEYEECSYYPLEDFLTKTLTLDTAESNVSSMSHATLEGTFLFKYYTDRHPTCYTTIDDNTLIFDGYYSTLDTTLQASKTYCFGQLEFSITLADATTFTMDKEMYSLLFNEAKAQTSIELKQVDNPKAEKRARRGWIRSQHDNSTTPNKSYFDRLPNFGRK
jgi:hypothetical protein